MIAILTGLGLLIAFIGMMSLGHNRVLAAGCLLIGSGLLVLAYSGCAS